MNKNVYTQEEVDKIIELREAGWSGTDIAAALGCDKNKIYKFCKWNNTPKGKSARKQQICLLHSQGYMASAIAKEFGISRQRVYAILKENECKIPPNGVNIDVQKEAIYEKAQDCAQRKDI